MRTFALILLFAELAAAVLMLVVAAIEIESILVTGPILALVGLSLALATNRLQSFIVFACSIGGPLATVLIASLIAVFDMSPDEARTPTIILLAIYLLFAAVAAFFVFQKIAFWFPNSKRETPPTFQFSLKALLLFTTATCLAIVVFKLLLSEWLRDEAYLFGGYSLVTVLLSAIVAWRFVVGLRSTRTISRVPIS